MLICPEVFTGSLDHEDSIKLEKQVMTNLNNTTVYLNQSNNDEPKSLTRLRNWYDLIYDLRLKLDDVRFTQVSLFFIYLKFLKFFL